MTRRDLTAADVLDAWRIGDPAPPHLRLARLMAVFVPGETLRTDTLGARNQRVIRLGRALLGDALEARLTCFSCGTEIEFAVPEDAILSASVPRPDTVVAVTVEEQVHRFRVPTMADLDAAGLAAAFLRDLIEQCRVVGFVGAGIAAGEFVHPRLAHRHGRPHQRYFFTRLNRPGALGHLLPLHKLKPLGP